ncbi:MAG: hypothetical protein RML12_06830 [Xanthomonadales bacterium]|nr:hypothetical protein [Xanthomonadales bacterium]
MSPAASRCCSPAPLFALVSLAYLVVGFFYCLATLYEERRDRSVLFWKSLPVSDGETVLAKAITVAVAGPLLALAVGLGGEPRPAPDRGPVAARARCRRPPRPCGPPVPCRVPCPLFLLPMLSMPLLALPTVGWLMLCSAAARARPFLWAVLLPVAALSPALLGRPAAGRGTRRRVVPARGPRPRPARALRQRPRRWATGCPSARRTPAPPSSATVPLRPPSSPTGGGW